MKLIPLTQGKFAQVDDEDFEWLNQWKWYAAKKGNIYCAQRNIKINGKHTAIGMHNFILNSPPKTQIEHMDGCGLNNQRFNLRVKIRLNKAKMNSEFAGRSPNNDNPITALSWEKQRKYYREWYKKNGRKRSLDYAKVILKYYKNNPERTRVNQALRRAIKRGSITKPKDCQICGYEGRIHSHHPNYKNALDVAWVCASCHKIIHLYFHEEKDQENFKILIGIF